MKEAILKIKGKNYSLSVKKSEDILQALDKILKKNKINLVNLGGLKLVFPKEKSLTSWRIIKIIEKTLNFVIKNLIYKY